MAGREFGEALDQEWAGVVDPESWVNEPSSWVESPSEFETRVALPEFKAHLWHHALLESSLLRGTKAGRVAQTRQARDIAERFQRLAEEWKRETIIDSSIQRRAMHRAYQQIIGLGRDAVPLILAELRREPDYWFWALTAITGEDPARAETTLQGARDRWLQWADEHGV